MSNREISVLPRPQPNIFNGSRKLLRRKRPGKSLDHWKEMNQISPHYSGNAGPIKLVKLAYPNILYRSYLMSVNVSMK